MSSQVLSIVIYQKDVSQLSIQFTNTELDFVILKECPK